MVAFDYAGAPLAIREDLPRAYRETWSWIASPGPWWTGAERVAIADEVRRAAGCRLCRERLAALSPAAVDGDHDAAGLLPVAAVEAVHRITTDASRLSRSWYEKTLAGGISDGHYVELLGVVVMTVSIDSFHHALGLPLEPLPEPQPGAPTRERPAAAREGMGYVPTLAARDAVGEYADLYPPLPQIPNVFRALSLVPANIRMLRALSSVQYVPPTYLARLAAETGRALSRPQIELIAGRVSALNECFY